MKNQWSTHVVASGSTGVMPPDLSTHPLWRDLGHSVIISCGRANNSVNTSYIRVLEILLNATYANYANNLPRLNNDNSSGNNNYFLSLSAPAAVWCSGERDVLSVELPQRLHGGRERGRGRRVHWLRWVPPAPKCFISNVNHYSFLERHTAKPQHNLYEIF